MPCCEITTMIGCTLRCTYCPQSVLIKAYKQRSGQESIYYLSLADFKKAIGKLPDYFKLSFAGMSEPWLNPSCTDMLAYALQKGRKISIYTTLVGMTCQDAHTVCRLLRTHAKQIINIWIHLPDASGHMPGWKMTDDYQESLDLFIALQKENILHNAGMMTMDHSGNLHPDLTYLNLQLPCFTPLSRAGNVIRESAKNDPEIPNIMYNEPVICSTYAFYDNNILLPNGDLLLCGQDYGLRHILGNLLEDDFFDILGNNDIYKLNTLYGSDASICKKCERAIPYYLNDENDWTRSKKPIPLEAVRIKKHAQAELHTHNWLTTKSLHLRSKLFAYLNTNPKQ